jgi:hypothetical protein
VNVLIRWRVWTMIIGIVLRPDEPAARLIDLPNGEARRVAWFLSAMLLVVITLVGSFRYHTLMDQDSGASSRGDSATYRSIATPRYQAGGW